MRAVPRMAKLQGPVNVMTKMTFCDNRHLQCKHVSVKLYFRLFMLHLRLHAVLPRFRPLLWHKKQNVIFDIDFYRAL